MDRGFERWSVRMGEDDRLFLAGGWSEPRGLGKDRARVIEGEAAVLNVPLHRARPYTFGIRMRGTGRVRLVLNQQPAGSFTPGPEWSDHTLSLSADWFRPGRNALRIRAEAEGVQVAGVWLE
jgi:hypothetical protein